MSIAANFIGAIVLCEAYALTKDAALSGPAQRTLDFVAASQDRKRGGWKKNGAIPNENRCGETFRMIDTLAVFNHWIQSTILPRYVPG